MKKTNLLAILTLAATPAFVHAQTSYTDPVGYVITPIAASTSSGVAKITPFSPVMLDAPNVTGASSGAISAVTSNTITVSSAGWAGNGLSAGQAYLQLTSGNQNGLVLRIISNTEDTATVDTIGLDLSSNGIAASDTFNLVVGETLLSLFGVGNATATENVVLGGTSSQFTSRAVDFVVALDTARQLRTYYFDTTANKWLRSGSTSDQGNVPIPPFSGLLYYRLANTPITLSQTGNVPTRPLRYIIPASGAAFLGRFFPQDGTLASYNLKNLSGWKDTSQSGVTTTLADKFVTVDSGGQIRQFHFDGTNWLRSGSGSPQNATAIRAGGAGYTLRTGSGAPQILTVPLPYTL
jgi:hypothetical protein